MNQWYSIVNECLEVLRRCDDIRATEKLRVEGRLIHMKKILVRSPRRSAPPADSDCCKSALEQLLGQISQISVKGCEGQELVDLFDLMDRIDAMLGSLNAKMEP